MKGKITTPTQLQLRGQSGPIPWAKVMKIAKYSDDSSKHYRITLLEQGQLHHYYDDLDLGTITIREMDGQSQNFLLSEVLDIVMATARN